MSSASRDHSIVHAPGSMTRRLWLSSTAGLFLYAMTSAQTAKTASDKKPARPKSVQDVTIKSSLDGELQPAWFMPGSGGKPAPLVVHLHSWSSRYDRSAGVEEAALACEQRGWAFLSPDFRGPNDHPKACASRWAIQDILDAVEYAKIHTSIDPRRIYLLGGSGGGHMALTMAHAAPKVWAAVSAWIPVTDLAAWHEFSKQHGTRYHEMLDQCCGGAPGTNDEVDAEYRARSPVFHLERAKGVRLDLEVGIHDGHGKAQVPVSQSLRAFNALAIGNGHADRAFTPAQIDFITEHEKLPAGLVSDAFDDKDRKRPVLFRRSAGPVLFTIFDGAHETDFPTAFRWLDRLE